MKKTIMTLSMAASVGLGTLFAGMPADKVFAESIAELEAKHQEIQSKSSGIENEINEKTDQIETLQVEQQQVNTEINRIDQAIGDTTTKISEKNAQIDEKNVEIEKLNLEIDELIKRIEERNELLKERAVSYQESGGMVSYIDVLVGAQSFSDFIDRVGAVAVILDADQSILKEQNADKEALEQKQAKVKSDLAELENMRKELETLKANLDSQKEEKNQLMASLEQEEAKASEVKMSLEEENEILNGQNAAIQMAIELEQQRLAEAKKQQEEEAAAAAARATAAKEAAAKATAETATSAPTSNKTDSSESTSTTSKASASKVTQQSVATAPVSGGSFTRPAAGSISSGFGYRSFNGGGFHYGVDIAKAGTVPVVAAADGVVSRSDFSSSYGNVIYISHSINGQTYTTVYAHLNSRSVGNMQTVSKGQVIGYMGNTGDSHGQHLHFELYRGGWTASHSNAINPSSMVPM